MSFTPGNNSANYKEIANWNGITVGGNLTSVGTNGGVSAYGTRDQCGNVWELTENITLFGGSFNSLTNNEISKFGLTDVVPTGFVSYNTGFRLIKLGSVVGSFSNFVTVGDIGNSSDSDTVRNKNLGQVNYVYSIMINPLTNLEYVQFLNTVDPSGLNTNNIFHPNMMNNSRGGIGYNSNGTIGNKYYTKQYFNNKPVNFINWKNIAMVCNWLHNGSGQNSSLYTGVYDLNSNPISRNINASYAIPTENEWYKAAFYDPSITGYWTYATQSNSTPCAINDLGCSTVNSYGDGGIFNPLPTPTVTPSVTPSNQTPTPTVTITPSLTQNLPLTPTPTITQTCSITPTISVTPTITNTSTVTPSISVTASITPTKSITPTPTVTVTQTLTPTITKTATPTKTVTRTLTSTPTVTPTNTPTISVTPSITPTVSSTPSGENLENPLYIEKQYTIKQYPFEAVEPLDLINQPESISEFDPLVSDWKNFIKNISSIFNLENNNTKSQFSTITSGLVTYPNPDSSLKKLYPGESYYFITKSDAEYPIKFPVVIKNRSEYISESIKTELLKINIVGSELQKLLSNDKISYAVAIDTLNKEIMTYEKNHIDSKIILLAKSLLNELNQEYLKFGSNCIGLVRMQNGSYKWNSDNISMKILDVEYDVISESETLAQINIYDDKKLITPISIQLNNLPINKTFSYEFKLAGGSERCHSIVPIGEYFTTTKNSHTINAVFQFCRPTGIDNTSSNYAQLDLIVKPVNNDTLDNTANYKNLAKWGDSLEGTVTTVGSNGRANHYGLYDISGQVYEWIEDSDIYNDTLKIVRGGCYLDDTSYSLSKNNRKSFHFNNMLKEGFFGLRIASKDNPNAIESLVPIESLANSNDCLPSKYGRVMYKYYISSQLLTNQEYCQYLNTVDPLGNNGNHIYDNRMAVSPIGGIELKICNDIGNKYIIKNNMSNKPVVFITWIMAAKYCNWLHNGQFSTSSLISGSYDLTSDTITRNSNAKYFIPNENEWYKAAYYDPNKNNIGGYWEYGTQSDDAPLAVIPNEYGDAIHPENYYESSKTFSILINRNNEQSFMDSHSCCTITDIVANKVSSGVNNTYLITANVTGLIPNKKYEYNFSSISSNWPANLEPISGVIYPQTDNININAILKYCPKYINNNATNCDYNLSFNALSNAPYLSHINSNAKSKLQLLVKQQNCLDAIKDFDISTTVSNVDGIPSIKYNDFIIPKILTPLSTPNTISLYGQLCSDPIPVVVEITNAIPGSEYTFTFTNSDSNAIVYPETITKSFGSNGSGKITTLVYLNGVSYDILTVNASKNGLPYTVSDTITIKCLEECVAISPTPTASITPTSVTRTPTKTPTVTPTVSPTVTITPSVSLSVTPTATPTPSITTSITPTVSVTPTVTQTISATPTITPTKCVFANCGPGYVVDPETCLCVPAPTTTIVPSPTPPKVPCEPSSEPVVLKGYAFYKDSMGTESVPGVGSVSSPCAGGHKCDRTDFMPKLVTSGGTILADKAISMNNGSTGGDVSDTFIFTVTDPTVFKNQVDISLECLTSGGCHNGVTWVILTWTDPATDSTYIVFNDCVVPGSLDGISIECSDYTGFTT